MTIGLQYGLVCFRSVRIVSTLNSVWRMSNWLYAPSPPKGYTKGDDIYDFSTYVHDHNFSTSGDGNGLDTRSKGCSGWMAVERIVIGCIVFGYGQRPRASCASAIRESATIYAASRHETSRCSNSLRITFHAANISVSSSLLTRWRDHARRLIS